MSHYQPGGCIGREIGPKVLFSLLISVKEPLINVCEAVSARQKSAKKRSL